MTIAEIYETFDKIGCLTFATVNEHGEPETRIAHLRAYDNDGLYFMSMFTKPFYYQLKTNKNISINGLHAKSEVEHDENGNPIFDHGYSARLTGKVREVSISDIEKKNNPIFDFCLKDHEKYKAMVVFCITEGRGDIFDYDFERLSRENKLERTYFSFNGAKIEPRGLKIDQSTCIHCGKCKKVCSFLAVSLIDGNYKISINRCDECGDCFLACPVHAISYRYEKNLETEY